MRNLKSIFIFTTITLLGTCACKKDKSQDPTNPAPVNPGELITTVSLIFTDSSNTSAAYTFTFKDTDGEGGNGPSVFDTIKIQANKTYYVSVLMLDETKTPTDTISNEVLNEANDHMIFFHHLGVNISTIYLDTDTNNPPLPIGISSKWKTGNVSNGNSHIILKHQPGTKNGTETPGETDVDITFNTLVE